MAKTTAGTHQESVNRFIDLANTMKGEGVDIKTVSGALMTASGLYASYVAGGNTGGLSESGVNKVVEVFRRELERLEALKKEQVGS